MLMPAKFHLNTFCGLQVGELKNSFLVKSGLGHFLFMVVMETPKYT